MKEAAKMIVKLAVLKEDKSFNEKLDKAVSRMESREESVLTISTKTGLRRIRTTDLYYVESEGHNLIYHTKKGDFVTRERMGDAEKFLSDKGFFRSNKCYLVNLQHVEGIVDGCCEIGGEKLLISRARRNEFMTALTRQIGDDGIYRPMFSEHDYRCGISCPAEFLSGCDGQCAASAVDSLYAGCLWADVRFFGNVYGLPVPYLPLLHAPVDCDG